jgi:hypothetical protein
MYHYIHAVFGHTDYHELKIYIIPLEAFSTLLFKHTVLIYKDLPVSTWELWQVDIFTWNWHEFRSSHTSALTLLLSVPTWQPLWKHLQIIEGICLRMYNIPVFKKLYFTLGLMVIPKTSIMELYIKFCVEKGHKYAYKLCVCMKYLNGLRIWRIAVNMQSRTADKGWASSLGVGRGANNSSP